MYSKQDFFKNKRTRILSFFYKKRKVNFIVATIVKI